MFIFIYSNLFVHSYYLALPPFLYLILIIILIYLMLSFNRIYTYSIHMSFVSFYLAASLFNTFLIIYCSLWVISTNLYLLFSLLLIAYTFLVVSYWVNDLMVESFIFFNYNELSILYTGFKLFILSELLIFLSLFASYFNYMLLSVSMSSLSLFVIFFSIPFSNLLILLYSSFSVQSSLIFIKFGYFYNVIEGISQTISIGILFLVLQFKEFLFSIYSYSSSFLGSLLYFTTGLHGLHVIIGLLFLLFSFFVLFLSSISFISFIHVPVLLPLYLSHLSYCSSTSYYFFNHSYLHISSLSYLSYNSSISYYFFLPHVSLLFTSSNIKYFWLSCFLIIYSCLLFYCLTITSNISYLLFLVVSVLFVVIYGCLFLGVYIPQVIYLWILLVTMLLVLVVIIYLILLDELVMSSAQRRFGPFNIGVFGLLASIVNGINLIIIQSFFIMSSYSVIMFLGPLIFLFILLLFFSFLLPMFIIDVFFVYFIIILLSSILVFVYFLLSYASFSKYSIIGSFRIVTQFLAFGLIFDVLLSIFLYIFSFLSFSLFSLSLYSSISLVISSSLCHHFLSSSIYYFNYGIFQIIILLFHIYCVYSISPSYFNIAMGMGIFVCYIPVQQVLVCCNIFPKSFSLGCCISVLSIFYQCFNYLCNILQLPQSFLSYLFKSSLCDCITLGFQFPSNYFMTLLLYYWFTSCYYLNYNYLHTIISTTIYVDIQISYHYFNCCVASVASLSSFSFVVSMLACFPLLLFIVFNMCILVESNRVPFDLPEAESELVAGFMTEFSSLYFSIIILSEYFSLIIFSLFTVLLFNLNVLLSIILLLFYCLTRATLNRLKYDELLSFGWYFLLIITFALFMLIIFI